MDSETGQEVRRQITDKISKIEVTAGKTINLGNYESYRFDVSMTANFRPGEYSDSEYEELKKIVWRKLQEQVAKILP